MLKLHTQEPEAKPERERKSVAPTPAERDGAQPAAARRTERPEDATEAKGPAAAQTDKATSIEKLGRIAPIENPAKTDKPATIERSESEGSAQPAKKRALDSLFKKFLPGTDPARKK
jgi:hypothetical protein